MDEKDRLIQRLTREVAIWKNRAVEASCEACNKCEIINKGEKLECDGCRMKQIREEGES